MLAARGRVEIDGGYEDWLEQAHLRFPLREAPLSHRIALISLELELPHRDPADRFLAATADVFDLVLLTVDRRLVEAEGVRTAPF